MLLCIDTGNTNTVFSIWDGTRFIATWRTATEHTRTADQYFVYLSTLMSLNKIEATITDVIISSTVPRVVFNLRVLCDRYFDCRPLVVGKTDCRLPVAPRVDQGTTVGPDRSSPAFAPAPTGWPMPPVPLTGTAGMWWLSISAPRRISMSSPKTAPMLAV